MALLPRIPLQLKLVLASSVLLALPYLGYQYINETERYLRAGLEEKLLDTARALSSALADREAISILDVPPQPKGDIVVHRLTDAIQIDGYASDWRRLARKVTLPVTSAPTDAWTNTEIGQRTVSEDGQEPSASELTTTSLPSGSSRLFDDPNGNSGADPFAPRPQPLANSGSAGMTGFSASYRVGELDGYLFLLVEVVDKTRVYARTGDGARGRSDHIRLAAAGATALGTRVVQDYIIDTVSPGWTRATQVSLDGAAGEREYRIRGEWRETGTGYLVELRIPMAVAQFGLRLTVVDVNDPVFRSPLQSAVSGPQGQRFGELVTRSDDVEALIGSLGVPAGRKVVVYDRAGRIRAQLGSLIVPAEQDTDPPLYRWLLASLDAPSRRGAIPGGRVADMVTNALDGEEGTNWSLGDGRPYAGVSIVTAVRPLRLQDSVVGAVRVEETARPIQTVRRDALKDLVWQTIVSTSLAALVLLWFATRLGRRLARLRNDANDAIDRHGRVVGQIRPTRAADEIGDLSRSISDMVERLRRYNDYLEQLASRLSHELRTPIAVVRSSLENLEHAEADERAVYSQRAMEGLDRLNTILSRMGEATRIEQAVRAAELETFDVGKVVTLTTDAYRQIWPDHAFSVTLVPPAPIWVEGVPDLIVQALDKVVANATEFADVDKVIALRVEADSGMARLQVENFGPPLPDGLADQIFDSLVSERGERSTTTPHLGLGLYVVRLIAEFHGGDVRAATRLDGQGVVVEFAIPLAKAPQP